MSFFYSRKTAGAHSVEGLPGGWLPPPADTPQTSPTSSSPLSPDIQVDDVAAPRRVDHSLVRLPSLWGQRIRNNNAIASNFNPF